VLAYALSIYTKSLTLMTLTRYNFEFFKPEDFIFICCICAPAEIEFCAFCTNNLTSGGN